MALETSLRGRAARILTLLVLSLGISTLVGCGRISSLLASPKEIDAATKEKLTGTWVAWHDKKTEVLDLKADGTFRFMLVGDSLADFSGTWKVERGNLEMLITNFVSGNRSLGNSIRWSIEKVEQNEIVLGGLNANTTYKRKAD
jgi:hypothetical protein